PGVIAVGSTNIRDERSIFSTRGGHISVSAPGESIYSCSRTNNVIRVEYLDYEYMSGTSMAAPFVAGIAVLLLSRDPSLTPDEIRSMIESSADDLGPPGFDESFGHGRVNASRALTAAKINHYGTIIAAINYHGLPLSNVELHVLNQSGTVVVKSAATGLKDAEGGLTGRAVFSSLTPGGYQLTARVNGASKTVNASVAAGEVSNVVIDF
ncbi:MAG TPA: hypothetical protein ENN69_01400, partial [Spirochaetia bacterium]|nr:hypothetical protein [Spirochaetia bacterium]